MIDSEYNTIPFPFSEITPPSFFIRQKLDFERLLGLIRSWSATQKYLDTYNNNPLELLEPQLVKYWKEKEEKKEITWKLILKVGRS